MKSVSGTQSARPRRITCKIALLAIQPKGLTTCVMLAPLFALSIHPVLAQAGAVGSPQLTENAPAISGLSGILGVTTPTAKPTLTAPGVLSFELLRGNGTRNGYILLHAAVLPDTLSVHAGGGRLTINQDYW